MKEITTGFYASGNGPILVESLVRKGELLGTKSMSREWAWDLARESGLDRHTQYLIVLSLYVLS